MSICMLEQKNLPNSIWGKVVTTTAYVLNMHLTKRLKNKVLVEVWSGKKSSMSHLKVIGSIYYKHIPDTRRIKLDDKS